MRAQNVRNPKEYLRWGESSLTSRAVRKNAETAFQLRSEAIDSDLILSDHAAQRDASPHLETLFAPASHEPTGYVHRTDPVRSKIQKTRMRTNRAKSWLASGLSILAIAEPEDSPFTNEV